MQVGPRTFRLVWELLSCIEFGFIGVHFHPNMQHFAVNDRRHCDLFEVAYKDDATEKIMHGNAKRVLGIQPSYNPPLIRPSRHTRHTRPTRLTRFPA